MVETPVCARNAPAIQTIAAMSTTDIGQYVRTGRCHAFLQLGLCTLRKSRCVGSIVGFKSILGTCVTEGQLTAGKSMFGGSAGQDETVARRLDVISC